MQRRIAFTIIALLGSTIYGQGTRPMEEPLSPLAVAAVRKYEDAVNAAHLTYAKAEMEATKQEVTDLDKALNLAMQAKDLTEANKINALKGEVEQRRELMGNESQTKPGSIRWIVGTSWKYANLNNSIVSYVAPGVAESRAWRGGRGTWTVVDANTIVQEEPARGKTRVTFSSDRKYAFWVYLDKGDVAWAVRAN